jgi:hypothetical protein
MLHIFPSSDAFPCPTHTTNCSSYLFIPALVFEIAARTKKKRERRTIVITIACFPIT